MIVGFEYPPKPHVRRHGPEGYRDYESYRDWLRDEFTFRCVYCLHREKWYGRSGTFHIEHVVPTAVAPARRCEYANLVYACATCNSAKSNILSIPDPCKIAFAECLRVGLSGEVQALNDEGRRLSEILRLNNRANVKYRGRWMRALAALAASHPELYQEYMGFPDELPDLRPHKRRVPRNTKPEGAEECYLAMRERGALPKTY